MKLTRRSLLQGLVSVPAVVGVAVVARAEPARSAVPVSVPAPAFAPKHISARIWHLELTGLMNLQLMRMITGPSAMEVLTRATIHLAPVGWSERDNLPHIGDHVVVADGVRTVFSGEVERLDLFWHQSTIDVIMVAHD